MYFYINLGNMGNINKLNGKKVNSLHSMKVSCLKTIVNFTKYTYVNRT